MIVRRGLYLALRWSPIVLPLWYMLVAGLRGWRDIAVLAVPVVGVLLAAALALVFGLTWMRKDVRLRAAVSWVDVGVLAVWMALVIASPLAIDAPMLLLVLIVGVVAFWSAVVQWVVETRRRVKAVIDEFGAAAASAREYQATRVTDAGRATPDAPLRGQIIRLDPPQEQG